MSDINRIDLPGGWYLVRCDEERSPNYFEWFLSDPEGVWVAKFWDGPETGAQDAARFGVAVGGNGQSSAT